VLFSAAPAAASTRVVVPERFHNVPLDGDSIVYATESGRSDVVVRRHLTTGAREELFRTRHDISDRRRSTVLDVFDLL
jgi:hypothetical protein